MTDKTRLLIGFDFTGFNFPSALYSLQQWAAFTKRSEDFEVIFGVSTAQHRSRGLPGAQDLSTRNALMSMTQYAFPLICWDEYVNDLAKNILRGQGIKCHASYSGFNYGSLVNRLLLLANEASCDFLIRVDPGTRPPDSRFFDEMAREHIGAIKGKVCVVSRGYEGRLAIRDQFVRDKKKHEELVEQFTFVKPNSQVTGGAMFTSNVPGTPAVPFEAYGTAAPTLVWGSDDAIFQVLPTTRDSRKLADIPIPRFDREGKGKSTVEYYRGVSGMVCLAELASGKSESEAKKKVVEFLQTLKEKHLDETKYKSDDEKDAKGRSQGEIMGQEFSHNTVAPAAFLSRIKEGWDNYAALLEEWQNVATVLKGHLNPFIHII